MLRAHCRPHLMVSRNTLRRGSYYAGSATGRLLFHRRYRLLRQLGYTVAASTLIAQTRAAYRAVRSRTQSGQQARRFNIARRIAHNIQSLGNSNMFPRNRKYSAYAQGYRVFRGQRPHNYWTNPVRLSHKYTHGGYGWHPTESKYIDKLVDTLEICADTEPTTIPVNYIAQGTDVDERVGNRHKNLKLYGWFRCTPVAANTMVSQKIRVTLFLDTMPVTTNAPSCTTLFEENYVSLRNINNNKRLRILKTWESPNLNDKGDAKDGDENWNKHFYVDLKGIETTWDGADANWASLAKNGLFIVAQTTNTSTTAAANDGFYFAMQCRLKFNDN